MFRMTFACGGRFKNVPLTRWRRYGPCRPRYAGSRGTWWWCGFETCRIYLSSFGMDSVFLIEESILDPGYGIWESYR